MKKRDRMDAVLPPFGMKDKLGYMFGDFGNDFTFILSSTFMLKFYTDVMGISPAIVGVLMMASRFVDAFTDVTMGQIVDRTKPTKAGKFRPWIKRMCGPVAVASFLIYQSGFAAMPYGFRVFWMVATYLLWGSVFYTAVNIPYGSMVSAISADSKDRAALSTWRTIGATLAGLIIGAGTPLAAYVTVNGQKVLSGNRMTLIAGIFSFLAIVCYLLCYYMTKERVTVSEITEAPDIRKIAKSLITNRALLGIIAAAILLLVATLGMQGMAVYVFPDVYGSVTAQSASSLLGSLAVLAVCAPLASALAGRFGKRELSAVSCLIGAGIYLVCLIVRPSNVWGYVTFFVLAYTCLGFFNTVIWAMITDVIDDAEVRNGFREDGTIYSVYSFARKLGQAFSSGMVGALLSLIGYQAATRTQPSVIRGIFNISCLVPLVGLAAVGLVLLLVYPLSKRRVLENEKELARRRKTQEGKE